jgi:DNA helicase II / ATP-dependent DNA helicase PcrA
MINFEEELNPEQLEAVLHGDGPCLVLAGAGSGKTRVITYRVAHLLERGIDPQSILLVTFTNKAADEMKKRLVQLMASTVIPAASGNPDNSAGHWIPNQVGNDKNGNLPWAGTFHHIAYRILRQYAPVLGYKNHWASMDAAQYDFAKSNFTVLDSDDSEALIKLCAKNFKVDGESKKFPSAKVLHSIISYARNSEESIADVLELKYPQWLMISEQIKSISDDYYRKKKEANAMDFDDLLVNFLLLLSSSAREGVWGVGVNTSVTPSRSLLERGRYNERLSLVGEKFAQQFKYILVDEYQDTNKIQASIIKKLASVHCNILVVGDDAQSIYSFRAADVQNILQFEKDYPQAKIFKLETNYRSSQEILQVANEVIANNVKQYKKQLKTLTASGLKPALYPQMDQTAEAEFVAQKILELVKNGTPENEIAVLFRATHHSQMLEMELVKAGIVYDYRGGLRFFERAHVKDVLAYLRILNNFADTAAWMRVLMHEEGIGPGAAGKIVEAIQHAVVISPLQSGSEEVVAEALTSTDGPVASGILDSRSRDKPPLPLLGKEGMTEISHFIRNDIVGILGEKARAGWYNFVRIWESMLGNSKTDTAALIDSIINSPYKDYLETEFIDSKDRLEDIAQLQVFANKYNELEQFLAEASLQESFNIRGNQNKDQSGPKVVLSTIHQAKGLEWSAVFIINLASGAFPHERALREDNGLEEERRLFYVAITRAKKYLHLTYPMTSSGWGDSLAGPSLFLGEISSDLLDDHSLLSNGIGLVLNNEETDATYESEEAPLRLKPGSFLRSVEDL